MTEVPSVAFRGGSRISHRRLCQSRVEGAVARPTHTLDVLKTLITLFWFSEGSDKYAHTPLPRPTR